MRDTIGKNFIDLLIVTHPHHDHYLGMEDLAGEFTIAEFWGSPYSRRESDQSITVNDWNEYHDLRDSLVINDQKIFICSKGARKTFSGCEFIVLGPRNTVNYSDTRECHDASLVVWVSTPANNFLICGDASDSELNEVMSDWIVKDCDVLHVSHHGSKNGANLDFIKTVSARDTIISTQSGIFKNLPCSKTLQWYQLYSSEVFRTDLMGTLITPILI